MDILKHIPMSLDLEEITRKVGMKQGDKRIQTHALVEAVQPLILARGVCVCLYRDKI